MYQIMRKINHRVCKLPNNLSALILSYKYPLEVEEDQKCRTYVIYNKNPMENKSIIKYK